MGQLVTQLGAQFERMTDVQLYTMRGDVKKQLIEMNEEDFKWLHHHVDKLRPVLRGIFYSVVAQKINIANGVAPQHTSDTEQATAKTKTLELNECLQNIYKDYINFAPNVDVAQQTQRWLSIASGNATSVSIEENDDAYVVSYGDHVTRMQALSKKAPEKKHMFIIPKWTPFEYEASKHAIPNILTRDTTTFSIDDCLENNADITTITRDLTGFDYTYLENNERGSKPVQIKCPFNFTDGFNICADGEFQTDIQVLHMPVKLSTVIANTLNESGRRLPNGDLFDDETLYIPPQLLQSDDVMNVLHHAIKMERAINSDRLKKNLLLLTLRSGVLEPTESLGQGGWHIDGHQGAERIQNDGQKVPTDRVYCISNCLSTKMTDLRLNLDPVRTYAQSVGLTLDQFNIQDIIQKSVERAEQELQQEGNTCMTNAGDNVLFYANPYMLHKSRENHGMAAVKRSFLRLLFTVDERDRIGDTISPIIGPCYPFKIKNIVDILQLPKEVTPKYTIQSVYPAQTESTHEQHTKNMGGTPNNRKNPYDEWSIG
jgi:hypothetical protein